MPALVTCGKKWRVGGDDFAVPALVAIAVRLICIGLMIGVVTYLLIGPDGCKDYPNDRVHPFLYGSLLVFILSEVAAIINEALIFSQSIRGHIMNHSSKRTSLSVFIFMRVVTYSFEFVLNIICIVAIFGPAAATLQCPEYHSGPITFVKVVIIVLAVILVLYGIGFLLFLDPLGVCCTPKELKDMSTISQLGNHGLDLLDDSEKLILKKARIGVYHNRISVCRVFRKIRNVLCCRNTSQHRSRSTALQQMANALYTVFSNQDNLVPSDLLSGLILVSRDQKKKREKCSRCVESSVYCSCQTQDFRKLTFDHIPKEDIPDNYERQPPRRLDFDNVEDRLLFEDIVHYMKYAMSMYGWPLHVYNDLCCGVCQLCAYTCCRLNYVCCNSRHGPDNDFVDDNCCTCGVGTIRARTKLEETSIRYASYRNDIYMAPYSICFDHDRQSIVLSVRGTLSVKDILTDLSVSMTELRKEEKIQKVRGNQYVHTGVYNTAKEILKDLKRTKVLEELLAPDSEYKNYRLVLCGHSLGAGAASVLALLLKPAYPDLICFAFSTPGCIFSFPLALYTRKFITSVVLGNDVIPRTTFRSLLFMKRQVSFLLKECKKPKAQVIYQPRWVESYIPASMRTWCCGPHDDPDFNMEAIKDEIKPNYWLNGKLHDIGESPLFHTSVPVTKKYSKWWRRKARDKNTLHHFVDQIESGEKIASFPPGNMVHIQIKKKPNNCFWMSNDLWVHHVSSEDMCVMKIDRGMVDDHLPNAVMGALNHSQKQHLIKQGYNPDDKGSETWKLRRERMNLLAERRQERQKSHGQLVNSLPHPTADLLQINNFFRASSCSGNVQSTNIEDISSASSSVQPDPIPNGLQTEHVFPVSSHNATDTMDVAVEERELGIIQAFQARCQLIVDGQ